MAAVARIASGTILATKDHKARGGTGSVDIRPVDWNILRTTAHTYDRDKTSGNFRCLVFRLGKNFKEKLQETSGNFREHRMNC